MGKVGRVVSGSWWFASQTQSRPEALSSTHTHTIPPLLLMDLGWLEFKLLLNIIFSLSSFPAHSATQQVFKPLLVAGRSEKVDHRANKVPAPLEFRV